MARPKVLVSGCYDLLHAGHVTFFETAAKYGDLYVCIGSDENVLRLKRHRPKFDERERLYMVQAVRYVHEARIGSGTGMLDFEPDLAEIRPDYLVVNADGGSKDKRRLCAKYGVQYIELAREPKPGLPARSSTDVKESLADDARWQAQGELPYRICLAGGWLGQPFISKHHPGSAVVVNIHPTHAFHPRSGMATSSRAVWQRVRGYNLFPQDPVELARLLFGYENPPGTKYISGSQDQLGLTLPGVNRLYFDGQYWPERIDSTTDHGICSWLEQSLQLVELCARPAGYDPLAQQNITRAGVQRLGAASDLCWEGILARDLRRLGTGLTETRRAWADILPLTIHPEIEAAMAKYSCYGQVTSGCGGGYLVMATDHEIPSSLRVRVRKSLREQL